MDPSARANTSCFVDDGTSKSTSTLPEAHLSRAEREDAFLQDMIDRDDEDVQDVKGISLQEASLLRLDGCRVRRTHDNSPASPGLAASLVASSPPGSENEGSGPHQAALRHNSQRPQRSPFNGVLETSQAILENMAADTAASMAGSRQTPEVGRCTPRSGPLTVPCDTPVTTSAGAGGDSRQPPSDACTPNTNAIIRRQASFFAPSNVNNEAPQEQAQLHGGRPALLRPELVPSHSAPPTTVSSTQREPDPQPLSPYTFDTHPVSDMVAGGGAGKVIGAAVLRRCYLPKSGPLPGETYDANHDLQDLFAKLNAEDLTRPNRLNEDEEEDEMNTVLYKLKGVATAADRQSARPSQIPLPPTPDTPDPKDDASAALQTPLVPFQTWRFPNLGGKARESDASPFSTAQAVSHKQSHIHDVAPVSGQVDLNAVSLLSPVDWAGHHAGRDEDSVRPWSEASSSPTSTHHTKAPRRKDTVSPQLLRHDLDRRHRASVPSGAADSSFRYRQPSLSAPHADAGVDPMSSQSISRAYHRAFDMVCAAYERLQRRQPQPRKTVVGTRTSLIATSATTSPALPRPTQRGAGGAAPPTGTATTTVVVAPTPRGSPSLSTSLLRSSGYYSFGNRLSLSHHNRQTLGEVPQYLGSMSNLHVGMSAGVSPATTTAAAKDRSTVLWDTSCSLPTGLSRPITRRLSDVVLSRIKSRPLLQTTLFLEYNMATMRASRRSSSDHSPSPQRRLASVLHTGPIGAASSSALSTMAHNASTTRNSFLQAVPAEATNSNSNSVTAAPTGNHSNNNSNNNTTTASSSSRLGKMSNSSQVTFLEVDVLAEASDAASAHLANSSLNANTSVVSATAGAGDVASVASTGLRRLLTEVTHLQRHVHTIDNVEREVDNETSHLVVHVGMILMGWLEVVGLLGCGSFGQVFLCKDLRISDGHFVHPSEIDGEDFAYWNCSHAYLPRGDCNNPPTHDPLVAVKVVKSDLILENQSRLEAEMLVFIGAQTADSAQDEEAAFQDSAQNPAAGAGASGIIRDPPERDPRCQYVSEVLGDGMCYGHHCIIMERYGANLYEYVQRNDHKGLPMYQIRSVGQQLFSALTLLHDRCGIIHADIKPENMLLTLDSCRSNVAASRPTDELADPHSAASARSQTPKAAGLKATPMEKSLIILGKAGASPSASVVQTSNGVIMEKVDILAPQPVRVQALNHPSVSSSELASLSDRRRQGEQRSDASGAHVRGDSKASLSKAAANASGLQVKLIDFSCSGSVLGPFYEYIQSRHYRAPEMIVASKYGTGIDMWSSGCLLAELLVGIPMFPGCNNHQQLALIQETVGPIPDHVLRGGSQTMWYYSYGPAEAAPASAATDEEQEPPPAATAAATANAASSDTSAAAPHMEFRLVEREEYFRRAQTEPVEYLRYFTYKTLSERIRHCPLSLEERRMSNGLPPYASPTEQTGSDAIQPVPDQATRVEIMRQRFQLFDLLRSLLNPDPNTRLTAAQALQHPFFTTEWAYLGRNGLEQ